VTDGKYWEAIVEAYESKGFTEEDALVQARVARILRKDDWDFDNNCHKLWTP
jgi:DNA polymerase-1